MRVSLPPLRVCLIGGGYLAVSAFSSLDFDAISPRAVPLWAYVGAHLAILAGLFQSDAPWKLGLAVPVFLWSGREFTSPGFLFFRDPRLAGNPSSDFAFGVVAIRDGRVVDAYVDPD